MWDNVLFSGRLGNSRFEFARFDSRFSPLFGRPSLRVVCCLVLNWGDFYGLFAGNFFGNPEWGVSGCCASMLAVCCRLSLSHDELRLPGKGTTFAARGSASGHWSSDGFVTSTDRVLTRIFWPRSRLVWKA